ncbi:MAG: DUF3311 domain-containing protein [Burkholderia sp.]|nr:DUF3311 domain-containing protein [Burkholderia sp.]
MSYINNSNAVAKRWICLLFIPLIAIIFVPLYNSIEPKFIGFPFFYWYQLLLVFISAMITTLVYLKTKYYWNDSNSNRRI